MTTNRSVWFLRSSLAVWLTVSAAMRLPAQQSFLSVPAPAVGSAPIADVGLNIQSLISEPGFYFGAGVQHSDNIQRTIDARQTGNIVTLATELNMHDQGPRLRYDLAGNLEWNRYLNGGYASKVLGYFDGKGTFAIVPSTFDWTVQETVNQLNADPLQAPTPNRFLTESYFSTGPQFYLRLGDFATAAFGGRYGRTSTGATETVRIGNVSVPNVDLSSNRYEGTGRLEHAFSRRTLISLNAASERVTYDNQILNTDYTSNTGYLSYEMGGPRMSLLANAGYTHVDVGSRGEGIPIGRFELTRRVSPMATVVFSVSQELQDALELGRTDTRSPIGTVVAIRPVQPAPTRNRNVGSAVAYQLARNTFVLAVEGTDASSEFDPVYNRRIATVDVRYLRPLRPTIYVELHGTYLHERYRSLSISDQERLGDIAVSYRPGLRHWLTLRYEYYRRSSTLDAASFKESRIGVAFVYRVR
jgi:hypothetical protein